MTESPEWRRRLAEELLCGRVGADVYDIARRLLTAVTAAGETGPIAVFPHGWSGFIFFEAGATDRRAGVSVCAGGELYVTCNSSQGCGVDLYSFSHRDLEAAADRIRVFLTGGAHDRE